MHYISVKQRIKNKIDKLFHIDRRSEYGYMAKDAFLAPDVLLFSKKNLYMYEKFLLIILTIQFLFLFLILF
jgi:hypothetical protein